MCVIKTTAQFVVSNPVDFSQLRAKSVVCFSLKTCSNLVIHSRPLPSETIPQGFDPEILFVLSQKLGFSLTFLHINWGWYDEYGNWNGQLGMVSTIGAAMEALNLKISLKNQDMDIEPSKLV